MPHVNPFFCLTPGSDAHTHTHTHTYTHTHTRQCYSAYGQSHDSLIHIQSHSRADCLMIPGRGARETLELLVCVTVHASYRQKVLFYMTHTHLVLCFTSETYFIFDVTCGAPVLHFYPLSFTDLHVHLKLTYILELHIHIVSPLSRRKNSR